MFFSLRRYAGIELGVKIIIHLYAHHRLKNFYLLCLAILLDDSFFHPTGHPFCGLGSTLLSSMLQAIPLSLCTH